jgi:2-dehydropantoate 2-reductase
MKIAIVGAGAIGGFLGVRLALAGETVTLIARGANLAAIRADGLTLRSEAGEEHARGVAAVEHPEDAGLHDAVLLAVKAHQVAAVAAELGHLCHADTAIVTMQNGIPWWYFQRHGGEHDGRPVRAADPDGSIARHVDPARLIGSVVYPAAHLIAPGVVQHVEGNRISLGELDGSTTPRIQAISAALTRAGLKAPVARDLRGEIWLKLWGNLSFNPISALTHATLVELCRFPATRELSARMMAEAEQIARRLGVTPRISIERRIAGAEAVGAHKTSMLIDVEHGRALELDALMGAVIELGELTGTPTPHISAVYACASLLAHTLATTRGRLAVQAAGPGG